MGLAGILIAIVLLFVLSYLGFPVTLLTVIGAIIVGLTNGMNLETGLMDYYMAGAADSFKLIIVVGLFGAIIAEYYKASGGATAIARGMLRLSNKLFKNSRSVAIPIIIVNLIGMVICYGGINGVIAVLVLMPIVTEIMKSYDIPRYIGPGLLLGATCTAAMTMPGSPQQQNYIPALLLGTSSTSGLVAGLIAGVIVVVLNVVILSALTKRAKNKGEHFEELPGTPAVQHQEGDLPNVFVALIPMLATFILFAVVHMNILIALAAGVILCVPCFYKQVRGWKNQMSVLTHGTMDSAGLLMIVCMLSGFGALVAKTDAFTALCENLKNIPGPATFKVLIAMMITVMIAGSGPAGEMAGVPMFAETFASLGVSLPVFHRIAAFAGTCLDTLPSNGGVNIATRLSGYQLRDTYKYCFLTSVLTTTIGAVVVTILLTAFPNWP